MGGVGHADGGRCCLLVRARSGGVLAHGRHGHCLTSSYALVPCFPTMEASPAKHLLTQVPPHGEVGSMLGLRGGKHKRDSSQPYLI